MGLYPPSDKDPNNSLNLSRKNYSTSYTTNPFWADKQANLSFPAEVVAKAVWQ